MNVVSLLDFKSRDAVSVLRALLAEATSGRIAGLAICYTTTTGREEAAFAGTYRARPAEAVNAAMRLSWKMTQAQDLLT